MVNLFPLIFLTASSIGFVSSLTLIQNFSSITLLFLESSISLPYFNWWKSEIESRNDYLKGVTINETKINAKT